MKRWTWMVVLLMAGTGGCVNKQDASSSAVRILNAVPDGSRMSLIVNGATRASGYDYGSGTPWVVQAAGQTAVRIDEALPADASPAYRTLHDASHSFAVNDELTLVVLGQAAGQAEEVVQIATRTRGVPTGKTRLQFINASSAVGPVDVYLLAPGTLANPGTQLTAGLAYKAYTSEVEVTGGNNQIVVTEAGQPQTVLLDSGQLYLPLEGAWTVAIIANPGVDSATRRINLVVLSGSGSALILDKAAKAQARFVNASPGSYAIDSFINALSVDGTARQACDPLTTETDTVLEECAQPYGFVGAFHGIAPGAYGIKTQKAADAGVSARTLSGTLAAGVASTMVIDGLVADTDTTTTTGMQTLLGTRRMATAAQLRVVDFSLAASATLEGDPATDRLELYITPPCAALDDEEPDFYNLVLGSDIGYRQLVPGDYQVVLARGDTAATAGPPVVLLSKRMTLAAGGIYTELITDSLGGVLPVGFLSVDDDPGLQDCPAPP
ncbi:hypothetical protein GPROT2_03859 [Gammaproteobacteria bacterium]|nr:MAG: DUF4397 domain-containing protein [Gammaproteobacteria bacterium]CAG0946659.1 hypothetical protein GPROT2_03859 [Gammaproteobacteria bacterium]